MPKKTSPKSSCMSSSSNQVPQQIISNLNGSEILIKALIQEQVKHIWGYPGGAVLFIYDALFKQNSIHHYLVKHEQAALHAADAYARATGEVGVALVTSGPGLTNAITGIATAYMDSVPLVVISGQVNSAGIGQDSFQECDAVGVTRPIVKHNFLIRTVNELATTIKTAFHLARSGRPGPVLIDIPKDISNQLADFDSTAYAQPLVMRGYNPNYKGHPGQIKRAAEKILASKRLCVYFGGGIVIANAEKELLKLATSLESPVVGTLMGLGSFPANNKLFLGMVGMHGTVEANHCLQESDVVIAVGTRFDDRVIGNPQDFTGVAGRTIIHIDIDPSSISKRVKAQIPIVGDAKLVLRDLLTELKFPTISKIPDLTEWWQKIAAWRKINCLAYTSSSKTIKPQQVIEKLSDLTKDDDAYITSDVGQHQMWVAQYYQFNRPRTWLNSGGLGTMGVGLPYAFGTKIAKPEADVYCITGDGSIQMCIQELSTLKKYATPIKIIILNNEYLGMVRQWQQLEYNERYSQVYLDFQPDFGLLAQAYGHLAIQVTKPSELEPALKLARETKDQTVILNILVAKTENVLPMVQAGKGLTQLLLRN